MKRRDFLKSISLATIGLLSPVSLEFEDFDYRPKEVLNWYDQLTPFKSTGNYLDNFGQLIRLTRKPDESDDKFRSRYLNSFKDNTTKINTI